MAFWVIIGSFLGLKGSYRVLIGIGIMGIIWVVVKMAVPFKVLNTIRHLVFRGPQKAPSF